MLRGLQGGLRAAATRVTPRVTPSLGPRFAPRAAEPLLRCGLGAPHAIAALSTRSFVPEVDLSKPVCPVEAPAAALPSAPGLATQGESVAQHAEAELDLNKSAIFEISLSFVVSHYMQLLIGFARNVFMCFRVVLILVIVGQAFKMAVFMLQIPISLYAVFFFEAFYTILQCIIAFIFIANFHNNVAFSPAEGARRAVGALRALKK
jgi:hypothetical protein